MIKIIKLILQGSFFYEVKNFFLANKNLKNIKKVDFFNIKNYYKKNKKNGNKIEKNVLVDFFFEHPSTNTNNYILNLLLSFKYTTNTIAFLKYSSCIDIKYVAKQHNIFKFDYVYSWKNFIYKYKAFLSLIKNMKNLKYDKYFGWHIYVDGIEIGDLVYDQFLRYTNKPTYRNLDILFLLYIFNSIFYFYRYKDVINKHNITDIILSHGVYADYGILAKVAASLEKDIQIYQWYDLNPLNISVHSANKDYIRKPRFYEEKIINKLISIYSKDKILSEYDLFMEKRFNAEDDNQIDLAFVYKNNDINNVEEFMKNYKTDNKKNIFIFSHAFVDSVKYVNWSLYSDYYTWLYETLVILSDKSNEFNIFIKGHPSESLYNCDITVQSTIDEINQKYNSNFIYLDKKVHNSAIFEIADSIITSNGTVAIEAVCFGIPVLVAASTQYENAKTVVQPKNLDEYRNYLENIENINKPTVDMIERAKLCFMFYSKYINIEASFLRNGDPFGYADRIYEYTEYNNIYQIENKLTDEPLYKAFSSMIDENYNDTVNIYR